jgi:HprK-related kinase B
MTQSVESIASRLQGDESLVEDALYLEMGEFRLRLLSNSTALLSNLQDYFSHVVAAPGEADMEIVAIEREAPELGLEYVDWKREPGKTGRKDSYFDIPSGRVVRKVRTGMVFLQSESQRIAAGPCLQYANQVINFINSQYMNWLQQRGWLICHASGLARHGKGFGIAGFSGGGKSTLMLRLLDQQEVSYLTNDRLFIRRGPDSIEAVGIPKLPRVNPGTVVHNPALHSLIPQEQREALLQLPPAELWELEDKYDVHVDRTYGPGRITLQAPLSGFLVLNWRRDSTAPLEVSQVDLSERRELLGAIMKSPGPFYQHTNGSFQQDTDDFDEQAYLDVFSTVPVYEASGGVDFDALTSLTLDKLLV